MRFRSGEPADQSEGGGPRRREAGIGAKLKGALRVLLVPFVHPHAYRPERHYMRGPGPKAQAKSDPHHDAETR